MAPGEEQGVPERVVGKEGTVEAGSSGARVVRFDGESRQWHTSDKYRAIRPAPLPPIV